MADKSVLISIQPKWCELIANEKKTVEVRKTKPKLETPFKVYIYETKGKKQYFSQPLPIPYFEGMGKVIGEFVCDERKTAKLGNYCNISLTDACLDAYELMDYADDKPLYGWHISNLVIYDKPKELSEFEVECKGGCDIPYLYNPPCANCRKNRLTKPPQSWCYVEEIKT